jgi:outer membrane immunogenic protein
MVVVSAAGAMAADLPARAYTKAPAFVEANDWSGIYIGGQVGYDWAVNRYTYNNGAGIVEDFNETQQASNPGSVAGGGRIGIQKQWSNWVLGIEGNYNWTSLKQADSGVLAPGTLRSWKTDGIAAVVGKVGYSFDRWMIYAKGGWADADINTFAIDPATGINGGAKKWQSGYTIGTGIDYKITQNWIAGAEFNYYNFKYDRSVLNAGGTIGTWSNSNANIYSLLFSLSYLFNWSSPVVAKF